DTIERNITVQAQTVNDLLDMSRILSGKVQLEQARGELTAVVNGSTHSLKPSAESKQIAIRLDMDGEELDVVGDEARLQQVIANLLGNAIKFTEAGGSITVAVERKGASVSLFVDDTGQGIAPAFLPHLF